MLENITKINQKYILIIISFFGIITSVLSYSGYGTSNQVEQLPSILRQFNPTYLSNDYFTNSISVNIVRKYYSQFISSISFSEKHLPLIFLLLTILSNVLIALLTYYLAYVLSNKSKLCGLLSSIIIMSISFAEIGIEPYLYMRSCVPATIVIPLLLLSIIFTIKNSIIISSILNCIVILIHPTFGIEIGLINIFIYSLKNIIIKNNIKNIIFNIFLSIFILLPFIFFITQPQLNQISIDSKDFIYILAHFRHPHHYLPSTFSLSQYLITISLLGVILKKFIDDRKGEIDTLQATLYLYLITFISIFIFGYIFSELLPIKYVVIAQPFQLFYFFLWLCLLLITLKIADVKYTNFQKWILIWNSISPTSLFFQILLFDSKNPKSNNKSILFLVQAITLPIVLFGVLSSYRFTFLLFIPYCFILFILSTIPPNISTSILFLSSVILITFLSVLPFEKRMPDIIVKLHKNISLNIRSEVNASGDQIIDFVKSNTPTNSVFLVPPDWGQFRISANRAIVIDFKAFPFADTAMKEWYGRIIDCYGTPSMNGFDMLPELISNYSHITNSSLSYLHTKYKVDYAIINSDLLTDYPTIYKNEKYKLIKLSNN